MYKYIIALAGVVLMGGVLLFSQSASAGSIKIGFVGPLTGSLASVGESSLAGAMYAVYEINAAGGLLGRHVELVVEDDGCSAKGAGAITKLINIDKVVAITGPDCSSSASAALPIAEKAGVPVVVRWASAPSLAKIGDYIFRVYPSDAFQGKFIAEYIYNDLGQTEVAVLNVKNDWGQGIADVFKSRFTELGGVVVYESGVLEDSRDLKTQLNEIKNSNATVLFAPLHAATGVVGLKQAKELGLTIPIVGGDVFESAEVQATPAASGVRFSAAVISNPTDFQARVKAETGKDGSVVTAPLAYDSVMVIAAAIERAGTIRASAIQRELVSTSYRGVSSPLIEFDQDGDLKVARYEVKIIP